MFRLISRKQKQRGATMVEYGIMVALIAVVVIVVVSILGGEINDAFQAVVDCIQDPDGEACQPD